MNIRFRLLIAIACAALTGLAFTAYANEIRAEADKVRSDAIARYGGEVVELAVATRSLDAGSTVEMGDVVMREWLADLAPEGAITGLDDSVGRVLTEPVAKGAPLTELNFRDSTRAIDVPDGHVAVTIPASDKLGMSSEVESGSKVIAYKVGESETKVCADEVVVLSSPVASASAIGASQPMTIAVLPENVNEVLSASSSGTLRLVLPAQDVASGAKEEAKSEEEKPAEAPKSVPPEKTEEGKNHE